MLTQSILNTVRATLGSPRASSSPGAIKLRMQHAPRALAQRSAVEWCAYRHGLRPSLSAGEIVRRALRPHDEPLAAARRFRHSPRGRFFFDAGELYGIVKELQALDITWRARTVNDAERLYAGIFRLLGADDVRLATKSPATGLPWHADVMSDYRWDPNVFHRKIQVPYGRADIKVPWELSRCQHFPTLGIAFNLTGDGRYAALICAQIDDWIASNRYGYGVNWACAMDVAIRAINWLWGFRLIAASPVIDDAFVLRLLASLVLHGRHIEKNIERYAGGITTNHTLAAYAALFHLGLLLPDLVGAERWYDLGRAGVIECMNSQVDCDGVAYENSIPYHRLVLEMFLACEVLAQRNGRPLPPSYRTDLERMFEFVAHYTRPDGLAPMIGDSDDGRWLILGGYFDWDAHDHRYLLAIGACMFDRADFARAAVDSPRATEEAAWVVGSVAKQIHARPSYAGSAEYDRSHAFPASGRYLMRHEQHYALICADEVGTAGLGNHKHNDLLSYELSVGGVAMVVDPGSYVYTGDLRWRDRFRSARAHSTVMIDGVEQNEMTASFNMNPDAEVEILRWESKASYDLFDASHTGYHRLDHPATHRRGIVLAKQPFGLLLIDTISGSGQHGIESRVQLAPGGEIASTAAEWLAADQDLFQTLLRRYPETDHRPYLEDAAAYLEEGVAFSRGGVKIRVLPFGWGRFSVEQGWYSPRYGRRVGSTTLRLSLTTTCPSVGGYLIAPSGDPR